MTRKMIKTNNKMEMKKEKKHNTMKMKMTNNNKINQTMNVMMKIDM